MIQLDILSLLNLLPHRITDDEVKALAYAIDPELTEITATIDEIIIIPRIDRQPEDIVNLLAWQFHVDFYEPLGFSLDKKRALVKNSLDWHRRKGTKSVVEEIVQLLFFPDFHVEEWFEYGGKPYFFKIFIKGSPVNQEGLNEVINAVNAVKNERSWLEGLDFDHEQEVKTFSTAVGSFHLNGYTISSETPVPSKIYDYSAGVGNIFLESYCISDLEPIEDKVIDFHGTGGSCGISSYHVTDTEPVSTNVTDYHGTGGFTMIKQEQKGGKL